MDMDLRTKAAPDSKQRIIPKVVTLNKGLKLAESWVNNMSSSTDEATEKEPEGRPPRLGLGARSIPNAKVEESTDPVERKLLKKLNMGKRQSFSKFEKPRAAENDTSIDGDDDDDDDEPESRISAFSKKRAVHLSTSVQSIKRRK